jgi:predicted transcriptional regulator
MNANEIADELDGRLDHVAANMLRKQQIEIETLKEKAIKQKEKNYEIFKDYNKTIDKLTNDLTDDEIIAIVNETLESWNSREAMLKFARSLLRKARGDV